MLQDPEFLYRIEVGTPDRLSQRLRDRHAPLVPPVGSAPDDRLLELAEDGRPRRLRRAARRGRAPARRRRARAIRSTASTRCGSATARSRSSADLLAAFNPETTALIDKSSSTSRPSYLTLFSSDETYIDDLLADHYGLPRPRRRRGLGGLRRERARRHPLARQRALRVQQVHRHQPDPARHLRADAPAL